MKMLKGFKLKFRVTIFSKLILYFLTVVSITLFVVNVIATKITNREIEKQFISSTGQILRENRNYVESVIKNASNYVNQLSADVDFYNLLLKKNNDFPTYYRDLQSARKRLDSIVLSDNIIDGIQIIVPMGVSLYSPSMYNVCSISPDIIKKVTELDFYKNAEQSIDKNIFIPPHKDIINYHTQNLIISYIKSLKFVLSNNESAVMFINIKPNSIQDLLSQAPIGEKGYMFIVDKNGYVISDPDSKMLGVNVRGEEHISNILSQNEGQFVYYDSRTRENMFAIYTSSNFTGWKYVAVVPEKELTSPASKITKGIMYISIFCFILAVAAAFLISLSISRPINEVTKAMAKVESGDLNTEVKFNSKDELGKLGKGFNNMVDKINKLIEEEYKSEIAINKVKLELLQMQINPHLLYNTLAMVSYTAKKENEFKIVEITENLSNFYKGILSRGKIISSFKEEVDMIKIYIDLVREVYKIDIDIVFDIDEGMYDLYTIKLLLQPIIENSVLHGIKPKKGGTILLSMHIEDSGVETVISDNGIGMDKSLIDYLNSITSYKETEKGYGMSNIIKRIKLFFGNEYGLKIESTDGEGTNVIMKLPVLKKDEIDIMLHNNLYEIE